MSRQRQRETEGKTVHTDSFDTTYLKQGRRCMQRRIRWRQVHSDRMKNDVRVEGIVLSIVSWRCVFGKTDREGDGQDRRRYDDKTDIEMDEMERDDDNLKTDGGWDVRAGVAALGKGKHLDRKGRIVYECRGRDGQRPRGRQSIR